MSRTIRVLSEAPGLRRVWQRVVDANPVLAKELLVTARTPIYAISIVLAPVLLGTLVLAVRRFMMPEMPSYAAHELSGIYFGGLTALLGTIGAGLGSTVVVQDRETGALDALRFSVLGPSRIVIGKLAAVLLAEALVVVCTLPLLALVLTLGTPAGQAAVAMTSVIGFGVASAAVGVAVSAHAPNAQRSLLFSLLGATAIGIAFSIWQAIGSNLVWREQGGFGASAAYFHAPKDARYVVLLLLLPAYGFVSILGLAYAVATSGLEDTNQDRGLPIKSWTLLTLVAGSAVLAAGAGASADSAGRWTVACVAMTATAMLATILLFFFAAQPVRKTRRMAAHPPPALVRALLPACLGPSIGFTLIACGASLLSIPMLAGADPSLAIAGLWTLLYLSTLGGVVGHVAVRRGATWARAVGVMALIAFWCIVVFSRQDRSEPGWVDSLCPLWLVARIHSGAALHFAAVGLAVWAASAALSLGAMLRTIRAPRSI
jgi:hypothetical protein